MEVIRWRSEQVFLGTQKDLPQKTCLRSPELGSLFGVETERGYIMEQFQPGSEFFAGMSAFDREIADRVAAEPCTRCGGKLHKADYPRKPREGAFAPVPETWQRRFSFCCGAEGCRKRATPPSVRFMARRVYLGFVVTITSMIYLKGGSSATSAREMSVPRRTLGRWQEWWTKQFIALQVFVDLRARCVGIDVARIPESVVEQLPGTVSERLFSFLQALLPLTSSSATANATFLRDKNR